MNPYVRINSKIRIYKTCIRLITTYGTEVRENTDKTKSMPRMTEMMTPRTTVGKTRRDNEKRRHQRAMRNTRYGEVGKTAYDHVGRMDENRIPKIALEGNSLGSRPDKNEEIVGSLPLRKKRRGNVRINKSTDLQEVEEENSLE